MSMTLEAKEDKWKELWSKKNATRKFKTMKTFIARVLNNHYKNM